MELIYLSLRAVIWLVLIFTLVMAATFLSARIMLEENNATLITESTLVTQRNLSIDREVATINSSLKEIASIQKDFVKWSAFLVNFTAIIPPNVTINSLALEKGAQSLTLQGTAATRDEFLLLKNNLEQLPYLSEVNSPITNLLLKQNLDFQFTAKINFDLLP